MENLQLAINDITSNGISTKLSFYKEKKEMLIVFEDNCNGILLKNDNSTAFDRTLLERIYKSVLGGRRQQH